MRIEQPLVGALGGPVDQVGEGQLQGGAQADLGCPLLQLLATGQQLLAQRCDEVRFSGHGGLLTHPGADGLGVGQ